MTRFVDPGFEDENLIRPLMRRMKVKAALNNVRASSEALLHLLYQQREPLGCDRPLAGDQAPYLTVGDLEGGPYCVGVFVPGANAQREKQLLEGVEMIAQLLDRVELGIRHGLFSASCEQEAIDTERVGHRLSGGAK